MNVRDSKGWKSNFKHMKSATWTYTCKSYTNGGGGGGAGRIQITIPKENSAWVLDCGLDVQFTDGSDHMLRVPVPWSFYYLLDFSNGKKAKNLKFQWVLPYMGALAIRGLNQSLKSEN